MQIGDKANFLRSTQHGVREEAGEVISEGVTMDGLPYIEVQFTNGVSKYSTLHLRDMRG